MTETLLEITAVLPESMEVPPGIREKTSLQMAEKAMAIDSETAMSFRRTK